MIHKPEVQNARALVVLRRVKDKLTGHDFKPNEELTIPDQVDKLIQQATSLEVTFLFAWLRVLGVRTDISRSVCVNIILGGAVSGRWLKLVT